MSDNIEIFEEVSNPLDAVEELFQAYEWSFQRENQDELSVQVTGEYENYDLQMLWDEQSSCLQFLAQYSFSIAPHNLSKAAELLMQINSALWLGHFILCPETNVPALRHTSLFRGFIHGSGIEQVEDLVDIAIKQAEQHYALFYWLSEDHEEDEKAPVELALMQAQGVC